MSLKYTIREFPVKLLEKDSFCKLIQSGTIIDVAELGRHN